MPKDRTGQMLAAAFIVVAVRTIGFVALVLLAAYVVHQIGTQMFTAGCGAC